MKNFLIEEIKLYGMEHFDSEISTVCSLVATGVVLSGHPPNFGRQTYPKPKVFLSKIIWKSLFIHLFFSEILVTLSRYFYQ